MPSAIHAAGGFGADFTQNSLLAKYRPDLLHLPTTNGEHCTGDGIKMGEARPSIPPCSRCTLSCRQSPAALESPFLSGDRREDHRPGVGAGPPHRPREAGRRRCQDQVPRRRGHAYVVLTPPKHRLHILSTPSKPQRLLAGPPRRGRHHPECRGPALLQRAGPQGTHAERQSPSPSECFLRVSLQNQAATTSRARCGRASHHSGALQPACAKSAAHAFALSVLSLFPVLAC